MNLNDLSQRVHAANIKWWQNPETGEPIKRNKGELLCLIHSELSEMYEGADEDLMDDKLPDRKMEEVECVDTIIRLLDYSAGFGHVLKWGEFESLKDLSENLPEDYYFGRVDVAFLHACVSRTLEHERKGADSVVVANDLIHLLFYLLVYGSTDGRHFDFDGAFEAKMAFNATREDHKHEARKIAGGKQF